ncbi:hypothetical protein [Pseudomonas alabamensis]|jgi:hypothetical protein|uniref:hypothetical protein n=1 Tax=Pseudomonas alabamensis TaxID=3064349 RepID=UPI0011A14BAF
MDKLEAISSWIDSEIYMSLLDLVTERLGLWINHGSVPEVLLHLDVDSLKVSKLEIEHISKMAQNPEGVCSYVREKLKSLEGTEDEQEGRHPEDEKDIDVEEGPYFRNFLNSYLIELHFLVFNPEGLEPYLKVTRMPKAKKYAKLLSDAYSRTF